MVIFVMHETDKNIKEGKNNSFKSIKKMQENP